MNIINKKILITPVKCRVHSIINSLSSLYENKETQKIIIINIQNISSKDINHGKCVYRNDFLSQSFPASTIF